MQKEAHHPSDQDLLLTADGELPARRAAVIRAHLAACWDCRARMAEIESTIGDFVRTNRVTADDNLPPIAGPRALLKARLSEMARATRHNRWWQLRFVMSGMELAYPLVLALLIALGARFLYQHALKHYFVDPGSAYAGSLPNPTLTPGSARAMTFADLCSADHDEVIRAVPTRIQQKVFQEYGLAGAPAADYELDHLITSGLGGSDDIQNLWPEPHYNTVWNSYVKDQLEDRLHSLVCGGKVTLAAAQKDISSNWISAYEKYFHTDKPLPNNPTPGASNFSGLTPSDRLPAVLQLWPDPHAIFGKQLFMNATLQSR